MTIYYDSRTGNVERFILKVKAKRGSWNYIKISNILFVEERGHLITYTTNFGSVPNTTAEFLKKNKNYVLSISSSGNMNWGSLYGLAADKIASEYNIPILFKFELSGLEREVDSFILRVEEFTLPISF